jgi:RNA polymerase sigma-70 factor (ECF subfamily)
MKKDRLDDQQLVATFQQASSPDSFEQLYNRYRRKVYQTCLSMTNDTMSAQDYTQDIFIRVLDKLGSFQNRSTFSTWLYSVSYRYCLDQLRTESRLKTEPLTDVLSDEVLIDQFDGTQTDWNEWQYQVRESVLQMLPTDELVLLRLKYEEGLSVRAIGQQYNLSECAVKMRLKRSRDKLRQAHQNLGDTGV